MFYDKTHIVSNLLSRADTFIAEKIYNIQNLHSLIEVLPPRLPSFVLSLSLNYSPGSLPLVHAHSLHAPCILLTLLFPSLLNFSRLLIGARISLIHI